MPIFPSEEWLKAFKNKLNSDAQYAKIARNWEGDVYITVEPWESHPEPVVLYFDLWHGKCRQAYIAKDESIKQATLKLKGVYDNYIRILQGELHPMQAMLTRRLSVQGDMSLLMRNVPTVLDFVRCAQEVTDLPE
jgi:putative sterol carrier protein